MIWACFNGAAPMMERKTERRVIDSSEATDRLQWGRSDDGAENARTARSPRHRAGFNGAAPMMERKTSDRVASRIQT